MLIIPGLSESLGTVGKRIIRVDTTDTLLSVEVASSAPNPAWANRSA
jgi:hypothetical protein